MSKSSNINPPVDQTKGEFYRGRLWKHREPGLPLYPFVVEEIRRLNNPGKLENHHDYYLVLLVTEGSIRHCYKEEQKNLEPGQVMIMPPGFFTFHPECGYHKYLIGLSGRGTDRIFADFGLNTFQTITADPSPLLRIFRRLYLQMGKRSAQCIPEILGDCFRLLTQISLAGRPRETETALPLVEKIRLKLEQGITEPVSLREMAESFGMPLSSLHRVFHHKFGISPKRYQFELRMREAHELLEMSDLSIKEIADRVGFQNQYYFSNAVSKTYHHSPCELRNILRSQDDVILPPQKIPGCAKKS